MKDLLPIFSNAIDYFLFTSLIEMYFLIFTSSKVLFYLKNIVHPYTDSNELPFNVMYGKTVFSGIIVISRFTMKIGDLKCRLFREAEEAHITMCLHTNHRNRPIV